MGLARPRGDTIWLTGHHVFKKSTDAGATWSNVRPAGLPTLDIHAFRRRSARARDSLRSRGRDRTLSLDR